MSTITASSNYSTGDPYEYWQPNGWKYNPSYTYPYEPIWQPSPVEKVFPDTWTTDNTAGIQWPSIATTPFPPPSKSKSEEDMAKLMELFEKYNLPKPELEPETKPEPPKKPEKVHVGRFTDLDLDNDI